MIIFGIRNLSHFSNRKKTRLSYVAAIALTALSTMPPTLANAQAGTTAELAKQLANPIASLISVPFQFNSDSGLGPNNGTVNTLNIQPVIPISINDDWNLISRTILPIKNQNNIYRNSGSQFGLGDTVQSLFFSPKNPTATSLIWGVGPVIYIPTATDKLLGANTWGVGPTAVVLKQSGPWTIGGLGNHIWSIGNDKINATFLQPFISYSTPTAWTFALNTESTYNWNSEEWSVPVNGTISKVVTIGDQLVSLTAGAGYYAASSIGGASGWRGRLVATFLFPK